MRWVTLLLTSAAIIAVAASCGGSSPSASGSPTTAITFSSLVGDPLGGPTSVTVHTTPGATCDIRYTDPDGKTTSGEASMKPKQADADGRVRWGFAVAGRRNPGIGKIDVICDGTTVSHLLERGKSFAAPEDLLVKVATRADQSRYLSDTSGRTLYVFKEDPVDNGSSACTDACGQTWPPLIAEPGPIQQAPMLHAAIGSFERTDGTRQATYGGKPLYRFSGDAKVGDELGAAVSLDWSVAVP